MKVSVAALFLLILTITSAVHSQPKIPESVNPPPTCCQKYHEKVLPKKLVVGYRQALSCHLPAIIFITKRKREVCTNPNNDWVQEYIKDPRLPLLPSRRLTSPDGRKVNPRSTTRPGGQASNGAQVRRGRGEGVTL